MPAPRLELIDANPSDVQVIQEDPLQPATEESGFAEHSFPDDSMEDLQHKDAANGKVHWAWSPGLIEMVSVQNRALGHFQDALLESDSRPEKLLKDLEREQIGSITILTLVVFWLFCLFLGLTALIRKHWFYRPMSSLLFGVNLGVLLINMTTVRSRRMEDLAGYDYTHAILAIFEFAVFLLTAFVLLKRTLPGKSLNLDQAFMDHLRSGPQRISQRIISFFGTSFHIGLVMLAGLIIANVLLLPIYMLQLSFQKIFVLLLIAFLLGLAIWYIRAYLQLARDRGDVVALDSGIAFLGYRLSKNSLFIISVIIAVSLVITIILLATVINTNFLQSINFLPVSRSL